MNVKSDFDLDLSNGEQGERYVHQILSVNTVEVKRDFKWFDTGNLYIETECYYQKSQSWQPSGLSVTKATHWAIVLGDTVIMVPTNNLRGMLETKARAGTLRKIDCKIEPNPSRGVLIRIDDLLDYQRSKGSEITDGR